eukprot:Rhum_TRINITY_DN15333_c1_g1::Rhum_TRINITY_DN15333_c1_g1_i1::g.152374::m.152374
MTRVGNGVVGVNCCWFLLFFFVASRRMPEDESIWGEGEWGGGWRGETASLAINSSRVWCGRKVQLTGGGGGQGRGRNSICAIGICALLLLLLLCVCGGGGVKKDEGELLESCRAPRAASLFPSRPFFVLVHFLFFSFFFLLFAFVLFLLVLLVCHQPLVKSVVLNQNGFAFLGQQGVALHSGCELGQRFAHNDLEGLSVLDQGGQRLVMRRRWDAIHRHDLHPRLQPAARRRKLRGDQLNHVRWLLERQPQLLVLRVLCDGHHVLDPLDADVLQVVQHLLQLDVLLHQLLLHLLLQLLLRRVRNDPLRVPLEPVDGQDVARPRPVVPPPAAAATRRCPKRPGLLRRQAVALAAHRRRGAAAPGRCPLPLRPLRGALRRKRRRDLRRVDRPREKLLGLVFRRRHTLVRRAQLLLQPVDLLVEVVAQRPLLVALKLQLTLQLLPPLRRRSQRAPHLLHGALRRRPVAGRARRGRRRSRSLGGAVVRVAPALGGDALGRGRRRHDHGVVAARVAAEKALIGDALLLRCRRRGGAGTRALRAQPASAGNRRLRRCSRRRRRRRRRGSCCRCGCGELCVHLAPLLEEFVDLRLEGGDVGGRRPRDAGGASR